MTLEWYKISYIATHRESGTTTNESKMVHVPSERIAEELLIAMVRNRKHNDRLHGVEKNYTTCIEHKPNWNQQPGRTKKAPVTGNCQSIW